jgi:hypothetical protein
MNSWGMLLTGASRFRVEILAGGVVLVGRRRSRFHAHTMAFSTKGLFVFAAVLPGEDDVGLVSDHGEQTVVTRLIHKIEVAGVSVPLDSFPMSGSSMLSFWNEVK